LFLLLGTVLAAWLATAMFTYFDAGHEIDEMLDAHLAQSAGLLLAQVGHEVHELESGVTARAHRYERTVAFQVWKEGTLLLRSSGAPSERLSATAEGFSDSLIDGRHWRVFGRRDAEGRYLVQVGERYKLREELARSVASHLMHPLVIALPALALLVWLATGWGLRPLARIAREVQGRAPDNLTPLDAAGVPREVTPLLHALNALFARVAASMDKERRFTADAAHELRTPLAAVKTQAQVALGARSAQERERALQQVVAGADRTAHLVEQLLVLARLDPGAAVLQRQPVRLDEVAAACLAELAPVAAAKRIDVGLEAGGGVTVAGDPVLLGILLRNLVDNAVRYNPAGGAVSVAVEQRDAGAVLVVEDNGPGIPAAERGRVTERFYRVLGSGEEGSGLGLSIVQRIAELHGAVLRLGEGRDGRGLRVEVVFP
jgi:two-component system sensor histidine kinase QseC